MSPKSRNNGTNGGEPRRRRRRRLQDPREAEGFWQEQPEEVRPPGQQEQPFLLHFDGEADSTEPEHGRAETTGTGVFASVAPAGGGGVGRALDDPPAQRRRPNRTRRSPWIAVGVVAVGVAGGALAFAEPADFAPTGQPRVDDLMRMGVVVLGAAAGSRARRWTLYGVAAASSVLATGAGLLFGLAAVVVAAGLIFADARHRLAGAFVGAGSALAVLQLRPVGFVGLTALWGTGLMLTLFVSAYGHSGAKARHAVRVAVTGCVMVLALGAVSAVVTAFLVRNDVERAVDATRRGAAQVRDGESDRAVALLGDASDQFATVSDRLNSPWVAPARLIPGVAQNLNGLRTGAALGRDLNDSAAFAATNVDYQGLRQEGGGVDLNDLEALEKPVGVLSTSLDAAQNDLVSTQSPWLVGPLASRLDELNAEVGELAGETELAELALADAPSILGADGKRRYFVVVANPAEGRDFGGFLGGWAIVTAEDGAIHLEASGTPLELFPPTLDGPALEDPGQFPPAFVDMQPDRFPQNWTSSADLDVVARAAAQLLESNGRGQIDGVMYVDPAALGAFVDLTGPVPVPGTPVEVTGTNTEAFFTRDQFRVLPQTPEGDEALADLTGEIFDRLGSADLPGPRTLADTFGPLVRDGHLAMVTFDTNEVTLLDRLGLRGEVPVADVDFLGVTERNLAPNKLDVFLERTHTYEVAWDSVSGARTATLTSSYHNDVNPEGLAPVVVGNNSGAPPGTQERQVAIITNSSTVVAQVDGEPVSVRSSVDDGRFRHAIDLSIPPGATAQVSWTITGDLPAGPYELEVLRPANEGITRFDVIVTDGDRTIHEGELEPGRLVSIRDRNP